MLESPYKSFPNIKTNIFQGILSKEKFSLACLSMLPLMSVLEKPAQTSQLSEAEQPVK